MYCFKLCPVLIVLIDTLICLATPVIRKRFDLDCNGIPDICSIDSDGIVQCELSNGALTSFSRSTYTASCTSSSTATSVTSSATISGATSTLTSQSAITTLATGTLPSPSQFSSDNGTRWTIEYVGDLNFTGTLGDLGFQGDKCRTSSLGGKVIWNCGDMECNGDPFECGFSDGPSFYGSDSVMEVNASAWTNVNDNIFAANWSGDEAPQSPQTSWGMDASNVTAINDTTGVGYVYEIWRGASDGSFVARGNGVIAVTLESTHPVGTRLGPLLTGPDAIQLGLLAILSGSDGYIYIYSMGGPSGINVGRVSKANNTAFDASQYSFLESSSADSDDPVWSNTGSDFGYIPLQSDNATYGMYTPAGTFACAVYGSVFYSNYFQQYVIICNIYESSTNMYTAPNPWGPWSDTYPLLTWPGYGSMAHPEYAPGGSDKEVFFSLSPDGNFNMFKMTFDYDC